MNLPISEIWMKQVVFGTFYITGQWDEFRKNNAFFVFLFVLIIKLVFYHFDFFFWWSIKLPAEYQPIRNRNWWSRIISGIVCYYYSNQKAWMTTEILTSVLTKINRKMEATKRKITLFMDNAPCYPESLSDRFCNVRGTLIQIWKSPYWFMFI